MREIHNNNKMKWEDEEIIKITWACVLRLTQRGPQSWVINTQICFNPFELLTPVWEFGEHIEKDTNTHIMPIGHTYI